MLARAGGRYRVWVNGRILEASLRGRMKRGGSSPKVLVGDRVLLAEHPNGGPTIESVLDRRSVLRRRTPGQRKGVREVVANIDQVIVVGAARDPDWDPLLMDRFVAVAGASRLPAVIVVNKCDLDPDAARLGDPYVVAGYGVLVTSAIRQGGLDALREHLAGRTSVFTGPTGVGKSSLLNAVQPGLALRTGDVSERSRAGRHTTVSSEMHPLDDGGFVVDTPGLRDIGIWGLSPRDVADAFPEISALAERCRFDNCRHISEPGCAVRASGESGDLSSSRYNSYRLFLEEAARTARFWE